MDSITLRAPAKVNLFLRVLAKRLDGYHDIETLFEKVAIFDTVRIKKADRGIRLDCGSSGLPDGSGNLAYQAASMMIGELGGDAGVEIEIEKSIPIGAGLGGGSSDAAAVLIGIDRLYEAEVPRERIERFAKKIGADAPFFLSEGAWGVGRERGDAIEALEAGLELWHLFIVPPFSIRAGEAYEWSDSAVKRDGPGIGAALRSLRHGDITALARSMRNDLAGLAYERSVFLEELRTALLQSGAAGAAITGSGPVLFGIFTGVEEVIRSKEIIERRIAKCGKDWQILIAPTLNN